MRLWVFLVLDLIGTLLWIAFCVGLGYAIGQGAVDIAKGVCRYALYLTIALIVVVFARQYFVARRKPARRGARRDPRRHPRPSAVAAITGR